MLSLPRIFALLAFSAVVSRADSVWLQDVHFAVTHDAGFGNAVFVAGSSSQLGSWDPTRAVRLNWSEGNTWRGKVALPRGVATTWRPFARGEAATAFTNSSSVTWILQDATITPPAPPPAPHIGKAIYYVTGWTNPHILWRVSGTTNWTNTPLKTVSAGVFLLDAVGTPGRPLEFVPNDGGSQWDNPGGVSGANYLALPDAVWLRDGQIYDYQPPPSFTAPRFVTNNITSSYAGIPSRRVRVLLPRNYDANTNKVYPVVYFHDGQNVFDPGGAFGSWSADATIVRDTAAGLLREMLVVAVDNSDARMNEYRPPGDLYSSSDGIGDRYRDFLVNNVKPWVDANFRVSPRREDHALVGSSLGGLITHYVGMTSDVFGLLGVCSPSYWIAPNFLNAIASAPKSERRIWIDWGSSEGTGMWDYGWSATTTLDDKGMVRGRDLQVLVGAREGHNEAAWKRRLPELLRFLLPLTDGPNRLLLSHQGAPHAQIAWQAGDVTVQVPALRGFGYSLQSKPDLNSPAWTSSGETPATDPWGTLQFSNSASGRSFYRVHIR